MEVDDHTIQRIKERVLDAEREQRHLEKPHKILPQIRDIVREEVEQ
ncbi:hypothetical protein [Haloarcula sp. CGMCC 1.2071]